MEEQEVLKAEEAQKPTEASRESGPEELSEEELKEVAGGNGGSLADVDIPTGNVY